MGSVVSPGTLVSNIYVSKGANSVLQGFESISGQINVITKDPEKTDKLFLNVYMNSFLEKQFNANYAFKLGKWNNLTTFQTVQPAGESDRDKDDFLDLPLLTRYMLFNKLSYGKESRKGWHSNINLRFYNENRVGGQTDYDADKDQGSTAVYGQTVQINQPEFLTKTGYRFDEKHHISLFASSFIQQQQSYFGTVKYDANQVNFYGNLEYDLNYTEDFNLKTGLSFRYQNLEEEIQLESSDVRTYAGNYLKKDVIPGVFAENTMRLLNDKLTFIAGIRGDHHNNHGLILTPRGLIKYDLSPQTIIRVNIGSGWRTANLFSENINLLVSSRDVIFEETLEPEQAINYGVNLTQKFDNESISGVFNIDYYRTDFQNQIFPDYDSNPRKAIIQNFEGESISNGFQTELILKTWDVIEWKVGYNFLDVYRELDGEKIQLPFNSKHKLLGTFSFKPKSKKYHLDFNAHWFGKQRLPDTGANPVEFQRPEQSEAYATLNAQFTYNFKLFEIYAGCENIFDFRQERPILSWEDPFGPYFDTALVWGPTRGREFYLGVRYNLPQ